MAIFPMLRRSPSRSILDFAEDRAREADSIGGVITKLAEPFVSSVTQPQPLGTVTGPAPQAQPLGTVTGPAMQPTLAQETVTPEFMDRLFRQESGYNPNAVSPKGAIGVGQVLPSTAMDPGYGVPTIFDLADEQGVDYRDRTKAEAERLLFNEDLNMQFSNIYANAMADKFGGDPALTAAAYNAGPGAVSAYGGVPPYAETQGYVNSVAGGGGDTRLGGGAGSDRLTGGGSMNVEDILATLYPQMSPEEQKRQRRKDVFLALSQGFSALSQGRPVDVSNVVSRRDERERQAVLDMRERERARAAASLVYNQTGDRDLAAGVATRAISYGEVVSERERRRVEQEADRNRLRQEQAAGRLANIVGTMWGDLGLPDSVKDAVLAGIEAGDDPNTIFTLQEQAKVAEAARKAEEKEAAAAEQRAVALEAFTTSQDPVEQAAGRYMTLDPNLSLDDALTRAQELKKPSGGEVSTAIENARALVDAGTTNPATGQPYTLPEALAATILPAQNTPNEVADIAKAKLLFEGGANNPQTNKPFTSAAEALGAIEFYQNQGQTFSVTQGPDGQFSVTMGPSGAGAVPAAPVAAAPTVANAFTSAFGSVDAGVPQQAAPAAPVALPLEVQTKLTDLNTKEQSLTQAIATAPDQAAKLAAERELAQVQADKAAVLAPVDIEASRVALDTAKATLDQQIATAPSELERAQLEAERLKLEVQDMAARRDVDAATREATLAGLEAEAQKKQLEVEALERDAAAKTSAEYSNAMTKFASMEQAAQSVMDVVFDNWSSGVLGGLGTTVGKALDIPTQRSDMIERAKQLGSQAMLDALMEAKAAGVTLTPVSNLDTSALGASRSPLLTPEKLKPESIAKAVAFEYNYAKDALFGPKDLTRFDDFGNEYEVGANTLGVTDDTFVRHWSQIPPAVAEAWKAGEIAVLPTDDPAYAESANVINAMATNWELYQGDLDRSLVGAAEEPAAPAPAEDIPAPPPNIPADEWQDVWQFMSEDARAAYRAQMSGEQ